MNKVTYPKILVGLKNVHTLLKNINLYLEEILAKDKSFNELESKTPKHNEQNKLS